MRRSLSALFLGLLILTFLGCTQRRAPPPPQRPAVPEFQTFKSPKGDFEVTYATASWEVENDTSTALSLKHKTEDAMIQLIESDLGNKVTKSHLKMFVGLTIAGLKESFKDFKDLGREDTTFAGLPAQQHAFTCTEDGKAMKMKSIFFASGTKAYALQIIATPEGFDRIAPNVEKMLGTFKMASAEPAQ